MTGERDADDAVRQIDEDPRLEDAALVQKTLEYEDARDLGETLTDTVDDMSEAWRRMRGIIGPF